jgi:hypothetical protein
MKGISDYSSSTTTQFGIGSSIHFCSTNNNSLLLWKPRLVSTVSQMIFSSNFPRNVNHKNPPDTQIPFTKISSQEHTTYSSSELKDNEFVTYPTESFA